MQRAALCLAVVLCAACDKGAEESARKAGEHTSLLVKVSEADVAEVRNGLPAGAKYLTDLYEAEAPPDKDPQAARQALERARGKVQDLRVAKSTFFALAKLDGSVIRNDQQQDLMAGKSLFNSFPRLKQAVAGKYIETRGAMPEASRVKGRHDAQWVAATPIKIGDSVKGLYVTGWSWSAYAFRLENSIRGTVRSSLPENAKLPLVYVYVVVDKDVFGAPVSPEVNAAAIKKLEPLKHMHDGLFSTAVEITERDFGLAVRAAPALGDMVGIAVLRSET